MEPNGHNLREKDELTGDNLITGHEYDGIKELDNRLPKWWLWLFYITIIFAVVYFTRFHIIKTGDPQAVEYEKEVAAAIWLWYDPSEKVEAVSNFKPSVKE